MKIYEVGGAVRDSLMGLAPQDRDYVVVGATIEQMEALGFMLVGHDFPVFIHPKTHDQYALARTQRQDTTGRGYRGFVVHAAPDVTLEEDLSRRDLTINAMAVDESGNLVDPFGGAADLRDKVLRHIGPAFSEDPIRILRIARFAARHPDFTIAPETVEFIRQMCRAGAFDGVVPIRAWRELAKGLMEHKPSRMLDALREVGALEAFLPELDRLWGVPQPARYHPEVDTGVHVSMALDYAASRNSSLAVRFAVLMHDLGKGVTPPEQWPAHHGHEELGAESVDAVCVRLDVPHEVARLAHLACVEHGRIHAALQLKATSLLKLLQRTDAFRRPSILDQLIEVCESDARGRLGLEAAEYPQADFIRAARAAASAVNAGEVAAACVDKTCIAEAVYKARVSAIKAYCRTAV